MRIRGGWNGRKRAAEQETTTVTSACGLAWDCGTPATISSQKRHGENKPPTHQATNPPATISSQKRHGENKHTPTKGSTRPSRALSHPEGTQTPPRH